MFAQNASQSVEVCSLVCLTSVIREIFLVWMSLISKFGIRVHHFCMLDNVSHNKMSFACTLDKYDSEKRSLLAHMLTITDNLSEQLHGWGHRLAAQLQRLHCTRRPLVSVCLRTFFRLRINHVDSIVRARSTAIQGNSPSGQCKKGVPMHDTSIVCLLVVVVPCMY